jgi:hypothetical protein
MPQLLVYFIRRFTPFRDAYRFSSCLVAQNLPQELSKDQRVDFGFRRASFGRFWIGRWIVALTAISLAIIGISSATPICV